MSEGVERSGSEMEEHSEAQMETQSNVSTETEEPVVEKKKSKREDASPIVKKRSEKPTLKQKLIIKRSPKVGEGEVSEFKAITPTISASNSPTLDEASIKEEDDDLATSLAPLTPKQEPDLDDSGFSGRLTERMFSEESQNSDSSNPPQRMCSFCNCGEKSLLGQGDLTRYESTPGFNPFKRPLMRKKSSGELEDNSSKESSSTTAAQDDPRGTRHATWRRKRGPPRSESREKLPAKSPRKPYSQVDEYGVPIAGVDELSLVGHPEDTEILHVFEKTGHCFAHHCCAAWSEGVIQSEDYSLLYVDRAVFAGLSNRCSYCHRYGATIRCREPRCDKKFHYPCASGGGCFQDIKSLSLLCPEHTDKAEKIAGQEAQCVVCDIAGNISGQLFCTSCGQHYHGSCLDPAVEVNPVVRAGWQCPECKICQTCRQPGDDNKMLVCDTCDKGYHTFCLRPAMVTIPKNGWKCKNCRVCGDCGSRTPGNGPSSRWHLNFSVCDSCYQQRNKGLFCPVCCKAYRQFTQKQMLECITCKKFVHGLCDPAFSDSETVERRRGKVVNYLCPLCKNRDPNDPPVTSDMTPFPPDRMPELLDEKNLQEIDDFECFKSMKIETEMDAQETSQESLVPPTEDSISSMDYDDLAQMDTSNSSSLQQSDLTGLGASGEALVPLRPVGPGIGKPPIGKKTGKKPGPGRPRGRPPVGGPSRKKQQQQQQPRYTPAAMVALPGPGKRAPKVKIKLGTLPGTSSLVQSRWNVTDDDDPKATTVICAVKDDFTMKQDMCMSCGSLGKEKEGQLIACTQCGQCYHPFCVDVKVSRVILEKGWRCLDCTVCEGCDQQTDESRLILCDECDVSYHIYCLDPPLEKVPKGTWKCKWCAQCHTCGATTPGFACGWQNNFTQCGPCSSLARCPVCENHYREDDNIIHCQSCSRWLHTECDGIMCEDDAERASDYGYHCFFCRPITGQHGPLPPEAPPSPEPVASPIPPPPPPPPVLPVLPMEVVPKLEPPPVIRPPPRQHLVDGVCLSDRGRSMVSLEGQKYEYKKQRGRRGGGRGGAGLVRGGGIGVGAGGLLPISRLMSTDSKASEEDFDDNKECMDGEEMKLFPGDTPPHHMEGDSLASPEKDGLDPMIGGISTRGRGSRSTRMRIGMGVGGFMARSRARGGSLRGRGVSRGGVTGTTLGRGGLSLDALNKKSRRPVKKALLEDSFPAYLQEAFFGRPILDNAPGGSVGGVYELDDESYHADKDGGLESSRVTEIKSAIQVKDEQVFKEEKREVAKVTTSHTSPMLIDAALTPRSNSQTDELQLSDSRQHEVGAESDRDNIDDFDMILPELDNIFPAGDNFFIGMPDDLHEGDTHVGEAHQANRMDSDWLESNIDVDKKLNPDMLSELAHIDSKTIEDVFKGVLEPSPTTGGDGNFNLPPLPSPPLQSQAGDHFHHPQLPMHAPSGAIPTPSSHSQQLHGPSTPTQQPMQHGAAPSQQQDLTHASQHKLHAPSPGNGPASALPQSPMGLAGHSPHHNTPMSVVQQPSLPLGVHQQGTHPLGHQSAPSLSQFMAELSWQNSSTGAGGQAHLTTSQIGSQQQPQQPPQPQQQPPQVSQQQQLPPLPQPQPIQSPQPKNVAPPPPLSPQQQNMPLQHQVSTGSEEAEPEHMSWNKKNIMKWEKDEPLGHMATISPVLYANINHPELKTQHPDWNERAKHIAKIWRKIPTEDRAPYLDKARENRAANRRLNKANKAKSQACDNRTSIRLSKAQQLNQEVKRRKAAESAAAMPPPATVPTPDGLPRIPSQEHLGGGMSPNTGPHTPSSDIGTPVKPGTPHSPTPPDFGGDLFKAPPMHVTAVPSPQRENQSVTPHSDMDYLHHPATSVTMATTAAAMNKTPPQQQQQAHAPMQGQTQGQGHPGFNESFVVRPPLRPPPPMDVEPYARPPMTTSQQQHPAEDAHYTTAQQPPNPTPRPPHSENFGRPPQSPQLPLGDPYAHPPHTPRTPQEHYEPRFPTPAPRMAVPFSRGQQQVARPPSMAPQQLNPRGPSVAREQQQFSQQQLQRSLSADPYAYPPGTPHPMTPDPYSQPLPTPQGASVPTASSGGGSHTPSSSVAPPTSTAPHPIPSEGGGGVGGGGQNRAMNASFAELHPEVQQMLSHQRMAVPTPQQQTPYRASFYGNRPPWSQYPYYRGGEDKDNQQLRDLLAKQRQQTPKKQEQQELPGSQMPLHHWPSPEDGSRPRFPQQPGFPPFSQGGPMAASQSYTQEGPRPPPNYPGPARGPWPAMFPRGMPPRGIRPPQGVGFQGIPPQGGFPPRGFQGTPRMPQQIPEMRPQIMQDRMRSPLKDGMVVSSGPPSGGDPRHMVRHIRPGMMAMPRGMPPLPPQLANTRPQLMATAQPSHHQPHPQQPPQQHHPHQQQHLTSSPLATQPYSQPLVTQSQSHQTLSLPNTELQQLQQQQQQHNVSSSSHQATVTLATRPAAPVTVQQQPAPTPGHVHSPLVMSNMNNHPTSSQPPSGGVPSEMMVLNPPYSSVSLTASSPAATHTSFVTSAAQQQPAVTSVDSKIPHPIVTTATPQLPSNQQETSIASSSQPANQMTVSTSLSSSSLRSNVEQSEPSNVAVTTMIPPSSSLAQKRAVIPPSSAHLTTGDAAPLPVSDIKEASLLLPPLQATTSSGVNQSIEQNSSQSMAISNQVASLPSPPLTEATQVPLVVTSSVTVSTASSQSTTVVTSSKTSPSDTSPAPEGTAGSTVTTVKTTEEASVANEVVSSEVITEKTSAKTPLGISGSDVLNTDTFTSQQQQSNEDVLENDTSGHKQQVQPLSDGAQNNTEKEETEIEIESADKKTTTTVSPPATISVAKPNIPTSPAGTTETSSGEKMKVDNPAVGRDDGVVTENLTTTAPTQQSAAETCAPVSPPTGSAVVALTVAATTPPGTQTAEAAKVSSSKSSHLSSGGAFQAQFLEFSRRQSEEAMDTQEVDDQSKATDELSKECSSTTAAVETSTGAVPTDTEKKAPEEVSPEAKETDAPLLPTAMQTDGCYDYDDSSDASSDSECDYEVEQIFNLTMQCIHRDQAQQGLVVAAGKLGVNGAGATSCCHGDKADDDDNRVVMGPLLYQLDGAGDEDKPPQQNTGMPGMSPQDLMSAVQGVIMASRSNPSSPAMAGKTPPGTPRTLKTPPAGPKSPQRGPGGSLQQQQQQMHMTGPPGVIGQSLPPGMMGGVQPQMGGMIRLPVQGKPRPSTPHSHMAQAGPTMGNPPPPYPVQQPSGKSPKASQSPRPSPKPSPLQAPLSSPQGPQPSPHTAVASPHGMQSPVTGSRSGTPQMSPRGSGSQPGTPQSGQTYPGFPQVQQGPPPPGMVGHMAPRMPATTQAAMAQLAHMAQGSRPSQQQQQPSQLQPGQLQLQQQQQQTAPSQPQMMPPGLRQPHFQPHSMQQQGPGQHHPAMSAGHPMSQDGGQGQPPPSAIAAMLGQHPRPPGINPQMMAMFRAAQQQPGGAMHPSMVNNGGQRQQFLPPGALGGPPHLRQPHPGGGQGQMMGSAPTSQHLPMQGMRPQYPPGYPPNHPHNRGPHPVGPHHPHPGAHHQRPLHPGMHPPPRGYPPGEVQIHTMPNVALSQAAAQQHQQQQSMPPQPTSMPVNPAQAALSSLAQAHTVVTSVSSSSHHVSGVTTSTSSTTTKTGQQHQVHHTSTSAAVTTGGHNNALPTSSTGLHHQPVTMTTTATARNSNNITSSSPSAGGSSTSGASAHSTTNSVLPSSIAAILSQATKEQAELNAAAAAAAAAKGRSVSHNASAAASSASATSIAAVSEATASHMQQQPPQQHGKRFPGQPSGQRLPHMPPVASQQGGPAIRHPGNNAMGGSNGGGGQQSRKPPITPLNVTLLNEQPLLLEDLLEQEKIEQQRKQVEEHIKGSATGPMATKLPGGGGGPPMVGPGNPGLLSDVDFEKLKVDVMAVQNAQSRPQHRPQPENWMSHIPPGQPGMFPRQPAPPQMSPRTPSPYPGVQPPPPLGGPVFSTGPPQPPPTPVIQSPPPKPAQPAIKEPQTDEERQQHAQYDQWLNANAIYLSNQMKDIETKVNKHRKSKKSLSAKQRNAKKNGNELPPNEQALLANAIEELQPLTKQLESIRKQHKSHNNLLQDYRTKMQEFLGTPPNWAAPGGQTTGGPSPMGPPAPPGNVRHPPPTNSMPQPGQQPRMPGGVGGGGGGGTQPMRLPAQVRQEYENQMLQRIRMMSMRGGPPPPNPLPPPGHPAPPSVQPQPQQPQQQNSHSSPQPGHPKQAEHPHHSTGPQQPPSHLGPPPGIPRQPGPRHPGSHPQQHQQHPPPQQQQMTKEQHEQLLQQAHRQAAVTAGGRLQVSPAAGSNRQPPPPHSQHPGQQVQPSPGQPSQSQQPPQPPSHHHPGQQHPIATPPATAGQAQQQPQPTMHSTVKQPGNLGAHGGGMPPQTPTKQGTQASAANSQEPSPKTTILTGTQQQLLIKLLSEGVSELSQLAALEKSLQYYYGPSFQDENNPFSDTYLTREHVVKGEEPQRPPLSLRPPTAPGAREAGPRPPPPHFMEGESLAFPPESPQPQQPHHQQPPHFPGQHLHMAPRMPGDNAVSTAQHASAPPQQQRPPGFPPPQGFPPRQRVPHQLTPGGNLLTKDGESVKTATSSPSTPTPASTQGSSPGAPPQGTNGSGLQQQPPLPPMSVQHHQAVVTTTPSHPSTTMSTGIATPTVATSTAPFTTTSSSSHHHMTLSSSSVGAIPSQQPHSNNGSSNSSAAQLVPVTSQVPPTAANNVHLPPISVQLTPGAGQHQQPPHHPHSATARSSSEHIIHPHPHPHPAGQILGNNNHQQPQLQQHGGGFTSPSHPPNLPPFLTQQHSSSGGPNNLPPPMYTGHHHHQQPPSSSSIGGGPNPSTPTTPQPPPSIATGPLQQSHHHPQHHPQHPPADILPVPLPPPPPEKPKKKRKPKKKKDAQQQQQQQQQQGAGGGGAQPGANQNQGHMQLPLDLDLRPMRMPMLPQFPPDFSLGSSPHAASPGQLPQHPQQMLPPHSHGPGSQPQQPPPMMVGMDRMSGGEHQLPGSISPIQHHRMKGHHGNMMPQLVGGSGGGGMPPHSSGLAGMMPPHSAGGMVPPAPPPHPHPASSLPTSAMMSSQQHHSGVSPGMAPPPHPPPPHSGGPLGSSGGGHMSQHALTASMPQGMVSPTGMQNHAGLGGVPVTQPIPPQVSMSEADFKHKPPQLSPTSQNLLLKQLLASQRAAAAAAAAAAHGRPPSRSLSETTDDADEISLTPEQQRQLALIDRMPLFKEKELGEWTAKAVDEHSLSMDSMASEPKKPVSEYDFSKQHLDLVSDLPSTTPMSPPQVTATGKIKKRRKKKDGDPNAVDKPAKKRPRKAMQVTPVVPIKEDSGPDYSAILDKVMSQVRLLPPLKLTEPQVLINFLGMKDEQDLLGIYGYSSLEKEGDKYCTKPFPRKPPPTVFDTTRRRYFHEYSSHVMAMPWLEQDSRVSQFTEKAHPPLPEKPLAPSPPLIEGRNVISRASDKSPATIIDTSSPETGFEEKPSYPGLRLISHLEGKSEEEKQRECASPEIPVMCPVPRKVGLAPVKEEIKEELTTSTSLPDIKQEVPAAEPDGGELDDPMEDINNKVKDMSSAMGRLVKDPNEVSVTLTLNPNTSENIGGVIAAIADLLKIAVPPNYEVSRSPSPPPQPASSAELFKTLAGPHKHKEELIHLQNLLKSQPKFCRHCDIIVLNAGVRKKKADVPYLKQQDKYDFLDFTDETIVFCSQECYLEFDKAHRNVLLVQPKGGQALELDTKLSEPILALLSPQHSSPSTSATLSAGGRGLDTSMSSSTHSVPNTPDHNHHHNNQERGDSSLLLLHTSGTIPPSSTATTPSGAKSSDRPSLRKRAGGPVTDSRPLVKKWRGQRYRKWSYSMVKVDQVYKVSTDDEIHSLMLTLNITMKPKRAIKDTRSCCLCQGAGDLEVDGPGRLLNMDVDRHVHLNCALWSSEVYETVSGALMNVEAACKRGANSECGSCHERGATLGCFKQRCANQYHLVCARKEGVVFFSDKTILCPLHSPKHPMIEGELRNLSVNRKVYINREENRQVASIIHQEDKKHLLRIGSIIIQMIGQLLPHQIATGRFNTGEYIYPVGFKATRYYWSYRRRNKRCKYVCRINDQDGWPEFTITVIEEGFDKVTHRDFSATGVWLKVLNPYDKIRRDNDMLKMFPSYLCGEDLCGLTEPAVLRVIESLPGVELMANYHFKFGRSSLYKMPVTINPSGCARSEPKLRTNFKKPHTLHTGGHTRTLPQTVAVVTDFNIPYSKQFVHSKSQQYRRLKTEWRNNVYLRRSNIQGLGLFATRDLEKHTMVIEYIGELIRNEVAEMREKMYEQQHRGIYMFRIDDNTVVDATMTGGPARYINHSCNPNCVAEVVAFEKDSKIIIITKRRMLKGEELTYDYKFDFEDDQHKIPCMCGAGSCRKWMN